MTVGRTSYRYGRRPPPVGFDGGGILPVSVTILTDTVTRSGQDYTFPAVRSGGTIANAYTGTYALLKSTLWPPGALATDFPGNAFLTGPINFLAGSVTATFTVTVPATVYPE